MKVSRISIYSAISAVVILFLLAGCGGSGSRGKISQSSGSEIPPVPGTVYLNPDAALINVSAAVKPGAVVINLPGAPDPLPEGLSGYEIWRGPAAGFIIDADGLSASSGAFKIADSSIPLPAGINLDNTSYPDSGNYLVYSDGSWSEITAALPDGTQFTYIIRYKYDRTPELSADNDFAWSAGVTVQGSTMFFPEPKDINIFPSAQSVAPAYVNVTWSNPAAPEPVPSKITILRKETPFAEEDTSSSAGVTQVHQENYSSSFNKWKDETVTDGSSYYYKVCYEYDPQAGWDGAHTGEGITNSSAAQPGAGIVQPENVFATGDVQVQIESINGNVSISWMNFPSGTFYPTGKVIIIKGNGSTPPDLNNPKPGDDKFVIQYWAIKEAPGTLAAPTDPHPFNASLPAEQHLPAGSLSGSNGYTYALDLNNTAFTFADLPAGDYSYSFYIVDDSGNISLPLTREDIACVDTTSNPVSGVALRRNKASVPADITVSYTLPAGFNTDTDRIEIYYSTAGQADSEKGSGSVLKGPDDNHKINSAVLSVTDSGTYYFSVYAVFDDNAGNKFYSSAAGSASPITIADSDPGVKIIISQTSLKEPGECAAADTYNFDQTLTFTTTLPIDQGVIRYTANGTEPVYSSAEYDPAARPVLSAAAGTAAQYSIRAKYFTNDGSGSYSAPREDSDSGSKAYKIHYEAYDSNFEVTVKENSAVVTPDAGSGADAHFTRSADGLEVHVKYTPGCGETFTVYRNSNFKTEKTTDAQIGNSSSYISAFALPVVSSRMDHIAEVVAAGRTAVYDAQNFSAAGRDIAGGNAYRAVYFLKIAGRLYAADPASGGNGDLVSGQNVKRAADIYTVYPKLVTKSADMWNRPVITPYLWTKQEPVVQVDVTRMDFFSGIETPADNVKVYFRFQYGNQRRPYSSLTGFNIGWNTATTGISGYTHPGWGDPDGTEHAAWQAASGSPLEIIDVDPLPPVSPSGKKWYESGGNYLNYKKTIPAVSGRVFYQIDNPYDTARIGEKAHTDDVASDGEMDAKAFRTTVRFRVKAMNTSGYRSADNSLKSFESSTAAAFAAALAAETTNGKTVRKFDAGTIANPSTVSDFPAGYQSYPIEVCEHWEGWTPAESNGTGIQSWYGKHGITYLGAGQGSAGLANNKNERDDSRFKHFDTSKTRLVIYSHGLQPTGYYEVPVYRAQFGTFYNSTNMSDETTYIWGSGLNYSAGDTECMADHWITKGYNFAIYHWNKTSQSTRNATAANVPGPSETKVWYPAGAHGNAFFSGYTMKQGTSPADILADSVRSANQGMILAQEVLDSLPEGYNPSEIAIAGHSLGNNVVIQATYKIIRANQLDAAKVPANRIPARVDLLDPYYGTLASDDKGSLTALSGDDFKLLSGRSCQDYADVIHSKGIPVQWFRTTALSQWTGVFGIGENDDNWGMMGKVNFVKFYLSDAKSTGYVVAEKWQSGTIHTEAHAWYFRSITRDASQDVSGSSVIAVSAATPVLNLYSRLNAANMRYTGVQSNSEGTPPSAWRMFHQNTGDSSHKKVNPATQTFIESTATGSFSTKTSSAAAGAARAGCF